jgi:hypothetical protein
MADRAVPPGASHFLPDTQAGWICPAEVAAAADERAKKFHEVRPNQIIEPEGYAKKDLFDTRRGAAKLARRG